MVSYTTMQSNARKKGKSLEVKRLAIELQRQLSEPNSRVPYRDAWEMAYREIFELTYQQSGLRLKGSLPKGGGLFLCQIVTKKIWKCHFYFVSLGWQGGRQECTTSNAVRTLKIILQGRGDTYIVWKIQLLHIQYIRTPTIL